MRRNAISPEYNKVDIPGYYNMIERKSFLGSKLMFTENNIDIENQDIIYYQQNNGDQINLDQEMDINQVEYSTIIDKNDNHSIYKNPSQNEESLVNRTQWILEINILNILRNYLFAKIKERRSFENMLSRDTIFRRIDDAIYSYIDNNLLEIYKYDNVDLFLEYISLKEENLNKFSVSYDENISEKFKMYRKELNKDKSILKIYFTQEKNSSEYTFNYYFNLKFIKKNYGQQ